MHMKRLKEIFREEKQKKKREEKQKKKQEDKEEGCVKRKGKKRAAIIEKTPEVNPKAEEKKKVMKMNDVGGRVPYVLGRAFSKAAAGGSRAFMLPRPKSKAMIIDHPGAGSSSDSKGIKEKKESEERKKAASGIKRLRKDMPVLKQRGRGHRGRALEVASDPEAMNEARDKLRKEMLAPYHGDK